MMHRRRTKPRLQKNGLRGASVSDRPGAESAAFDRGTDSLLGWNLQQVRYIAVGLIAVATVLAYSNSFWCPFTCDDWSSIIENDTIRHLWPISSVLSPPEDGEAVQRRPVVNASLAINYAISGYHVWSYHVFNLITHLIAALLLFGIVRRTLLLPSLCSRWENAAVPVAFAVALFWAIHPLLTEAVTYVVQRTEVLAGLFYLLTLYCTIRGTVAVKPAPWYMLAVAACALAMGSKEAAISAPLIVLLYDRVFLSPSWHAVFRSRWMLYAGLAATWTIILALLPHGMEGTSIFGSSVNGIVAYGLAQGNVIIHYLRLCFWPAPLVVDYGSITQQPIEQLLPGVLFVLALLAATVIAFRYRPWLGFLGVWFFAILAPSSSIIPLPQQVAAEKRMYLPLAAVVTCGVIGVCAAGQWLAHRELISRRAIRIVGFALSLLISVTLGLLTYARNGDYRSELSLWQDTVKKVPWNPRAHYSLAIALEDVKQMDDAFVCFKKALDLNPNMAEAQSHFGVALARSGQLDAALVHIEKAIALDPSFAAFHFNRAAMLAGQGRMEEAFAGFEKALAIKPNVAKYQVSYGLALAGYGRWKDAMARYEKTLELDHDHVKALSNLATLLATCPDPSIREVHRAMVLSQRAVELTGGRDIASLDALATVYAESGRFPDAVRTAQMAVELATQQNASAMADFVRAKRRCYEAGTTYREMKLPQDVPK